MEAGSAPATLPGGAAEGHPPARGAGGADVCGPEEKMVMKQLRVCGSLAGTGAESHAPAARLLAGRLSVRRPVGLRKEKPGRRAQPQAHAALSGRLLPVLPPGAAAGGSVGRRCGGGLTVHRVLEPPPPSLTGLWAPASDLQPAAGSSLRWRPLVQWEEETFLPSGRAGLAARAAGAPCLGGRAAPADGWAHVASLIQVVPWGRWQGRVWPRGGPTCLLDNRPCRGTWPGHPHLQVGLQESPEA